MTTIDKAIVEATRELYTKDTLKTEIIQITQAHDNYIDVNIYDEKDKDMGVELILAREGKSNKDLVIISEKSRNMHTLPIQRVVNTISDKFEDINVCCINCAKSN